MVHFDVPGHKGGRGNKPLRDFFGSDCIRSDMNSMKALDNLCHPVSVIREAEELAADAFGAAHAFLMVGGASSCVEAMVMTAVTVLSLLPTTAFAATGDVGTISFTAPTIRQEM